jgi:flagellar biosynthetic protein FliP
MTGHDPDHDLQHLRTTLIRGDPRPRRTFTYEEDTVQDIALATRPTARRRWLRFAAHYLEMVVAMVVGMIALAPVWDALWPAYADRPDTAALAMAANMTVAMVAWMSVRGHSRRGIALMSAAMVLPFAALAVPYWAGVMPGSLLMPLGHVLMFPLMAVAMLLPAGDRH